MDIDKRVSELADKLVWDVASHIGRDACVVAFGECYDITLWDLYKIDPNAFRLHVGETLDYARRSIEDVIDSDKPSIEGVVSYEEARDALLDTSSAERLVETVKAVGKKVWTLKDFVEADTLELLNDPLRLELLMAADPAAVEEAIKEVIYGVLVWVVDQASDAAWRELRRCAGAVEDEQK